MYSSLENRVAVVTGAGRKAGIGAAIAERLAAEGARVLLTDLGTSTDEHTPQSAIGSDTELESIKERILADGGTADAMACDVRDEASVAAVFRHAQAQWGRVDIAVNNAGIGYLMAPLTEMEEGAWDSVLDVNLKGAFLVSKHAARAMIAGGKGGRIVNIASQAAKSGFPYAASYCSSKHGMIGLTRVAAIELGQHGITVNAICPNHITTGLGAWQNDFFSKALDLTMDEYMSSMKSRIPLGRPGLTADIAKTAAYLCSDEAEYVTGEAINVSGGEEMH